MRSLREIRDHNSFSLILFLALVVVASGCVSNSQNTQDPQPDAQTNADTEEPSTPPGEAVQNYLSYNWNGEYYEAYDLLSENATDTDRDSWYNEMDQRFFTYSDWSFDFLRVENETISDDNASVEFTVRRYANTVRGQTSVDTVTKEVDLKKENNSWRLSEEYDPLMFPEGGPGSQETTEEEDSEPGEGIQSNRGQVVE